MEISHALTTDLDLLTDALNDPDVDLVTTLQKLAADARMAVPSFLGLSLLVSGSAAPFTFTALPPGAQQRIATSLRLPLLGPADDHDRGASLVLYAAHAGAFVDLTADLSWLTGIGSFELDEHLQPPDNTDTLNTLRSESLANQAIGVLIAGGMTPEAADVHLDRLAADTSTDRGSAASAVLQASVERGGSLPEP